MYMQIEQCVVCRKFAYALCLFLPNCKNEFLGAWDAFLPFSASLHPLPFSATSNVSRRRYSDRLSHSVLYTWIRYRNGQPLVGAEPT